MKLTMFFVLFMLALPATARAQTTISVDMNKAKLRWTWAQGDPQQFGPVEEFRIKCGQVSKTYTKITSVGPTARELAVSSAIAGSGNWFCVVTAFNAFGESGASNEVPFAAGAAPSAPVNALIVAQ